jgi:hypothetical protein
VVDSGPAHGTLELAGDGSFTYTPAANYHGPDGFTFRVTDPAGLSDIGQVAITVVSVNDPPPVLSGTPSTEVWAGEPYSFTPTYGTDNDGDQLQFTVTSLPPWASLTLRYLAVDGAGNVGAEGPAATLTFDYQAPSIAITQPAPPGAIQSDVPALAGTALDQGTAAIARVEVQVDDGEAHLANLTGGKLDGTAPAWLTACVAGEGEDCTAWSLNTSGVQWTRDADHAVTARVTDRAGNTATATTTFHYYNSDPAFTTLALNLSTSSVLFGGTVSEVGLTLTEPGRDPNDLYDLIAIPPLPGTD